MHLWKVLYTESSFRPDREQTWPLQAILVSDWSISKKSSPLKPLSVDFLIIFSSETAFPNEPNLVGRTLEMSSLKIAHFVPFH
jgi:hypothetical protein